MWITLILVAIVLFFWYRHLIKKEKKTLVKLRKEYNEEDNLSRSEGEGPERVSLTEAYEATKHGD